MPIHRVRETGMTSAEIFEDFYSRIGLRNKISNGLMAIALSEVKSRSKNLSKYIADGLDISNPRFPISTLDKAFINHYLSVR